MGLQKDKIRFRDIERERVSERERERERGGREGKSSFCAVCFEPKIFQKLGFLCLILEYFFFRMLN